MFGSLQIEFTKHFHHLLQPPGADVFEETALFNTVRGSNVLPGKMLVLQNLQEVTSGTVFFQMEVHQDVQLILKRHFQGSVTSRKQGRDVGYYHRPKRGPKSP